ncbi:uncharacterized protein BDW43DRAFT_322440 [Aspergillus alliaceus]|uniref:uncharacterized protein n=1 Tax=Petromyces alliaceus TaxID=209559 RepID=UPI0012A50471|nr:uncharacterized protein BDW43DRAFT_322440 [Aspergillus alliaceus]KAB8229017.1 hypothetical protein BDW43DRAFT_322440 [Aspergillus alliaceus]
MDFTSQHSTSSCSLKSSPQSGIMDCIIPPPGIFETILTYLDLDSVKARPTTQKLAEKCIGPRFLGFIQQPILDVSPQSLRSLHTLACNPALNKTIYSLTLLATSLDSSELEKNVKSGKHTIWDSIHLDGAFIVGRTQRESARHGEWRPLWMRVSHVFSLIVTAMVQSGASVKKLDAYRSTPRCCIPSGDATTYAPSLNPKQLRILSKGLQSLKLSMSGEIQNALDIAESDEDTLSEDEKASHSTFGSSKGHLSRDDPRTVLADGSPGITSLLKSAPTLRELDLSFRHTLEGGKLDSYDRIIESSPTKSISRYLKNVSGFPAKGESILLFLQKHTDLRSFTLHECNISFAPLGQKPSSERPLLSMGP